VIEWSASPDLPECIDVWCESAALALAIDYGQQPMSWLSQDDFGRC
jgi:hypothetical protein